MYHSTYFGCIITRAAQNAYGLKWQAHTGSRFVYADTLAGIRQLIKGSKKNV